MRSRSTDKTPAQDSHAQLSRRRVLEACGAGLTLPGLLRMRAQAGVADKNERTAIIVLFCHGGPSHIDTYDPKPGAPAEIRGPFQPIDTAAPGMQITEILPRHAAIADKFCLLRSLAHGAFCHANGPQEIMTGHHTDQQVWYPDHPDCLAIANYLRWQPRRDLPNYVGLTTSPWLTPVPAIGPAYLGNKYAPFAVTNNSGIPNFKVGLDLGPNVAELPKRRELLSALDRHPKSGAAETMDSFQEQALDILLGSRARAAFDLEQEPAALRDKYGRTGWGQQCLLARRLVEAGVDLVTVTLSGSEAGGAANWDDHAVNAHIFDTLKGRAPIYDNCVSALIEDLYDRGLNERVLVVATGEFGRTPRISYAVGTATKVTQPGRDHWPHAMAILFAGGGIPGGQVIGSTNANGEHPAHQRVGVHDFLATIYRHLGIDAGKIQIADNTGRPVPILPEGEPITELTCRRT
jgi:hypothetical protein